MLHVHGARLWRLQKWLKRRRAAWDRVVRRRVGGGGLELSIAGPTIDHGLLRGIRLRHPARGCWRAPSGREMPLARYRNAPRMDRRCSARLGLIAGVSASHDTASCVLLLGRSGRLSRPEDGQIVLRALAGGERPPPTSLCLSVLLSASSRRAEMTLSRLSSAAGCRDCSPQSRHRVGLRCGGPIHCGVVDRLRLRRPVRLTARAQSTHT